MDNNFDSLLNVSAVPQDDKVQAFIAESKNNRNRCYELSEQVTAQVATDGKCSKNIWMCRVILTVMQQTMHC